MADVAELERTARVTYQRARDGHDTQDAAVDAVLTWLQARCPNTEVARLLLPVAGVQMALDSDWSGPQAFASLTRTVEQIEPSER